MKITLTLDNRLSIPVSLAVINSIHIVNVRSNGGEMGTGYVDLPDTYEVMPGKTTIVMQAPNAPTIYHGFGYPVTAFKLTGEVWVTNSHPDQLDRVKYCKYSPVEMGAQLQGHWGS
jgi:hypothetical protein